MITTSIIMAKKGETAFKSHSSQFPHLGMNILKHKTCHYLYQKNK